MMTLEEAIIHCKEKACNNTQCALEHRQLAEWLKELQQYRNKGKLKDLTFADAIKYGYEQAQQDYIEYAQLWVDSGEVNIKSFKQFLKDRGYE